MRSLLSGIVALGLTSVLASASHAWVYYGNTTLTAYSGSSVAASGTAVNMRAGWYQLAGKNYSSTEFSFTDRLPSNGRNAYGETLAYHKYLYYQPMPGGGQLPKVGTKYATSGFSSRVSGSWTGSVSSTWSPEPYTGVGSIFRICEDVRWAPDNCGTVSKYTPASSYS